MTTFASLRQLQPRVAETCVAERSITDFVDKATLDHVSIGSKVDALMHQRGELKACVAVHVDLQYPSRRANCG